MSYRCNICSAACPHGQARIVHTVYRDVTETRYLRGNPTLDIPPGTTTIARQEIAAEIPVCRGCKTALEAGHSVGYLRSLSLPPAVYLPQPLPVPALVGPVDLGEPMRLPWDNRTQEEYDSQDDESDDTY